MAKPPARTGPLRLLTDWTVLAPVLAFVALVLTWGQKLGPAAVIVVALLLGAAVLAAVHHADVVALRVGEPYGALILAVAVTIIEVALIITLMIGNMEKNSSLARDTVFAAVMITCNGIVGLSLLVGTVRRRVAIFNSEGSGAALATVATISTLCLVLPTFTTSEPGPEFSPAQLAFAAVASVSLYAIFVTVQTIRHREHFLPIASSGEVIESEDHEAPPTRKAAYLSLGLLLVALVAVVGDAKTVSPAVESGVAAAGLPPSVVGVVIALLVLLPETLAALRAARRDRIQTSLNLGFGSAIASIGLTIPSIAVASLWLDGPLLLGLGPTQMVLLLLTVVVGVLTVVPGRATLMQAGVHLAVFAAFLFLAINP